MEVLAESRPSLFMKCCTRLPAMMREVEEEIGGRVPSHERSAREA
jgi:hypothetical protein